MSEREEYIGLAYYQTASPDESTLDDFSNSSGMKRKSTDGDFRAKYKTEICKFWELNKECRYGDNVRVLFKVINFIKNSVPSLMVTTISGTKSQFPQIIRLRSVNSSMTMATVPMDPGVSLCTHRD